MHIFCLTGADATAIILLHACSKQASHAVARQQLCYQQQVGINSGRRYVLTEQACLWSLPLMRL